MVAQLQTYDCSSLIISSCNFALSTTATGNSSSAFDLQHPQPTTPSPSPNSSPAPSPHDSDDLYVEIDEMQITSSSLSSDPNNNRPNLPFGRRPMPFFDLPTSQTNQISRSILSKAIDNSSSQKSIINIINPNTLTDAELASSLIIQSLEYNKLESIKALSSIYTPLVSLGRCLMSAHDRMVVSEIVANLEAVLITAFHKAANNGESARAVIKLKELQEHVVGPPPQPQPKPQQTNSDSTPPGAIPPEVDTYNRMKFRFIERIAPSLLRPANSAMWSVRHQYDVDAIILVTEVVLDNCDIFFRPGWQERADALIQSHEQIVEQPSESGGSAGSPGSGLVPPPTQSPSFSSPSSPTSSPHRSSKTNASVNAPNGNLPVSMTHEEVLSIDKLIKGSIGRIFGISKLKQMNNKREDQAQDQEQKQEEILAVEAVVGADSPPKPNVPKTASPPAAPVVNPEHEKISQFLTTQLTSPTHLTSSSRKKMIVSCRTLRAEIVAFEKSFMADNNSRAPKGNERQPLAGTFGLYRDLKKVIRNDAAFMLQSFVRLSVYNSKKSSVAIDKAVDNLSMEVDEEGDGDSDGDDDDDDDNSFSLENINRAEVGGTNDDEKENMEDSPKRVAHSKGKIGSSSLRTTNNNSSSPNPNLKQPAATASASPLSTPELAERKRLLKSQLKKFDQDFMREKGRMPHKAEKEPIRHLYEQYNALKSLLETTDGGGVGVGVNMPKTPPSEVDQKELLKSEKQQLHGKLKEYEKTFMKTNRRQVSSFADIKPVANLYRRYKEIKKSLT